MHYWPLAFAALALIAFVGEIVETRGRNLIAWGLALFTIAFVLTFAVQGGSAWVLH